MQPVQETNKHLKEEQKEKGKDKYSWLDDSTERKYMTDIMLLTKVLSL